MLRRTSATFLCQTYTHELFRHSSEHGPPSRLREASPSAAAARRLDCELPLAACAQPWGLAVVTEECISLHLFWVCPFWGQEGAVEGPRGPHWVAGAGTRRLEAFTEMTCGWPRTVRAL